MGAGALADRHVLRQRVQHAVALVAHVHEVAAAVPRGHGRQGGDLVRIRVAGGGVDQPRGEAKGPGLHGLVHQGPHVRQLGVRGWAVLHAHRRTAHGGVPHQRHHVHPQRRHARQELVEGAPVEGQPAVHEGHVLAKQRVALGHDGRRGEAAVARDLRRHALLGLAAGHRVERQVEVGVGVDVDEARREHAPRGVHGFPGLGPGERPHLGNAAGPHAHVGPKGGLAGAVQHLCVTDQQLEHEGVPPAGGWKNGCAAAARQKRCRVGVS